MYANKLPAETEFFLYLLEQYARHCGLSAADVLAEWDEAGIVARIRENYDIYHAEALDNAFMDIDSMRAGDRTTRRGT
ncbi:MAG: DUF3791 domain-containing protein [Bifidobacteriaceae bacterium]|jgi:hypothetical protein|nr:DUF3791 domain-containing protein [Bifidobacteriaceae bacterium]